MEQGNFAHFLEDHAAELASPTDGEASKYERLFKERFATPAELIMLSRDMEIHVNAKVKRSERLQTGERTIIFENEHLNGKGEPVSVPGIFMVSVPAWVDGRPIRVPARLRYRMQGGGIYWHYNLYRVNVWLREQVINDMRDAAERTGLPAYPRAPEKTA